MCTQGKVPPLPSPLPFQTDEGRKAELKVGTLRQGERTRTHQKRKGVFSEAPQRRVGGSVRAVKWLIESLIKWFLLGFISFIRIKSYLRSSFFLLSCSTYLFACLVFKSMYNIIPLIIFFYLSINLNDLPSKGLNLSGRSVGELTRHSLSIQIIK